MSGGFLQGYYITGLLRGFDDFKNIAKFFYNCFYLNTRLLTDLVGIDRFASFKYSLRYRLVYLYRNTISLGLLALSVFIRKAINTISSIFQGIIWLEREVWDLLGIVFSFNPDLRRILTDYGFKGHALRKDFPLSGYAEIYFNDGWGLLRYTPVSLTQNYRFFKQLRLWK